MALAASEPAGFMKRGSITPSIRYLAALALALVAQLVRAPLDPPTLMPSITYVPFILLSGWLGGTGPGLLATALCTGESLYFATAPVHSFQVSDPQSLVGLAALAFTGVITSLLFEQVRRAQQADIAYGEIQTQLAREVQSRHRLLESVVQYSPAAIALLRGPDFAFDMINPVYQALCPGETLLGKTFAEVWPEAAPVVLPLLQNVRDSGVAYQSSGFRVMRRPNPTSAKAQYYFDFSYVPLNSVEKTVMVFVIETTQQRRAAIELRAAYTELEAIYANAPVVLFVINQDLRVEKVNHLAERFAGRSAADLIGQNPGDAIGCLNGLASPQGCGHGPACGQCPIRNAVLDSLLNGASHQGLEVWMPLKGYDKERCLQLSTSVMASGPARKVLICAQDITESKRTQLDLESALAEKTTLLKEIHHRVKNNLAVISSLLSMKAESTASREAQLALEESQQRVYSMALIHEHLYGNEHLDRIDFGEYTRQLVRRLEATFSREPARIAVHLDLDAIELNVERAVPCGLILNELLTNAFKYAFPGQSSGTIAVSFHQSATGDYDLMVQDSGIGLPAGRIDSQTEDSLGLRIVQLLTRQLDGSLTQEAGPGTRVLLRIPGDNRAQCAHP
jgi:two-component sensor histidine kinase/PAS domain-containing protein